MVAYNDNSTSWCEPENAGDWNGAEPVQTDPVDPDTYGID